MYVITLLYLDYIRIKYITRKCKNVYVLLYCVHSKVIIFGRPIQESYYLLWGKNFKRC